MRFRRGHHEIDAIRFDGSERAARNIDGIGTRTVALRRGEIEVATSFGRTICRPGQWIARDVVTGAVRVLDHGDFHVEHEAVLN